LDLWNEREHKLAFVSAKREREKNSWEEIEPAAPAK
jgi:hypothetical protein